MGLIQVLHTRTRYSFYLFKSIFVVFSVFFSYSSIQFRVLPSSWVQTLNSRSYIKTFCHFVHVFTFRRLQWLAGNIQWNESKSFAKTIICNPKTTQVENSTNVLFWFHKQMLVPYHTAIIHKTAANRLSFFFLLSTEL